MAFLDFLKNKQANQQESSAQNEQQPKPENAKPMYTRMAAEEAANRIAPTADQQKRAKEIGELMNKATQHVAPPVPVPANAPADGGSRDALLQKQNAQGRPQAALSPTDGSAGKTVVQDKQPLPEKTPARTPQTIARRPPSWER